MTQDQMIELARRAITCKGWRWIPGMKAVKHGEHATSWFRVEQEDTKLTGIWADAYPDLADPATLGCFLWLVQEAWEGYRVWIEWNGDGQNYELAWWRESDNPYPPHIWGTSEAIVLVAALEAAPSPEENP